MKKLFAWLTALVLLVQACPFAAVAEENGTSGLVTTTELTAALSLVGYGEDAPSWHDGMQVNGDLTAVQLIQFLQDVQDNQVHTLQNSYTDIENELVLLKTVDPAAYTALTTGENAGMEEYAHTLYRQMEGTRLQLDYWQTALENQSTAILDNNEKLEEPEVYTDYELRLWSCRIREATEEIRVIRTEIASQAETCLEQLDLQIGLLAGTANDSDPHASRLSGWADAVLHQRDLLIASATVSADSLFPTRTSLLARLSPITDEAKDGSREATVHVISDKEIGIRVLDEQGNNLPGVTVTVRDTKKTKKPAECKGKTSEDEGLYSFPLNGFLMQDDQVDFNMVLIKEGYKSKWMHEEYIKKGACITVKMEKDLKDAPYIAGCLYDGRDCLYNFYTTIYSQANDRVSPITVHVVNPTSDSYVVHLVWQNADGSQYYHTMGRKGDDGQETGSWIIGPNSEAELVMNARWRGMLKPGGNWFTMKIDGQDVPEEGDSSKGKWVLRLVLEKEGKVQAGTAKGSPDLHTGSWYSVNTGLQVQKAKLQKPFNKFASIPGLFKPVASLNFSLPIKEGGDWFKSADIGLDIPILDKSVRKWLPSVSVAADGSFSVFWGIDVSGDFCTDWKNQDLKDISEEAKKKSGFLATNLGAAKAGAIWRKAMQTKGGFTMEKKKGTIGVFFGVVGRMNYDANGEKWVSEDLSGALGLSMSYLYNKTRQLSVGSVPFFVGIQVTASAIFGLSIGGTVFINHSADLTEEAITNDLSFSPFFGGVTVNLNLTITGYVGLGVKGFAGASANVSGSFNILLEWIVRSKASNTLHLRINAGFSFYVLLEIAVFSAKLKIYDHDWEIYDDVWPKATGTAPVLTGSLFFSEAKADSVPIEPLTLTADDYPALVPESEEVLEPAASSGNQLEVMEIDGTSYAFRLAPGESGRNRVTWINLNDRNKTGTFEALLQQQEDQTLYNNNDISFCVTRVEGFGDSYYTRKMGTVYALSVLSGNTVIREDEMHLDGTPRLYTLGFAVKDGRLTYEMPRPDLLQILDWTMLHSVELKGTAKELDELLACVPTCSMYFRTDGGVFNKYSFLEAAAIGNNIVTMTFEYRESWHTADGSGSAKKVNAGSPVCSVARRDEDTPYYAVQKGGKGDQLVLFSELNGGVIAEAESIPYFRVLPGADADGDLVFFLTGDKDPYGNELYHLFSASIQHFSTDPVWGSNNPRYVITDLDITIPSAAFQLSKVGGTLFVHWLETGTDPKDKNRTVCRLSAVIYDRSAGFATDDMTFAQFSVPADQLIRRLTMTDTGVGYYTLSESALQAGESTGQSRISLCSFPLKLVASLDLETIALEKDVVSQGDDEFVTICVKNTGNMAITKFTMTENMISLDANGKGDLIQTVHADLLRPEKSYLHLEGDLSYLDVRGKTVVQRLPVVPDNVTQEYWEVKRTVRTYQGISQIYREKKETTKLQSREIMPGSMAIFKTLTKIPSTWKGKKLLTFTLTGYSAALNQLQAMAARSGGTENTLLTEADQEIEYTLGTDGKMHPETTLLMRASDGLVFADSIEPPKNFILDHELDNLVVSGTVYRDPDGTRMLRIVLTNDTVDYSSIRLECEVYLDGSETPYYLELPYYPEYMSSGCTQTIDLPLSLLANGTNAETAKVVIRGIGIEEATLMDNSFEVNLSGVDPLRIIVQPQSQTCAPKETVTLTVKAAGGEPPYQYQWQVRTGRSSGWQNIEGAADSTLVLGNVTTGMNDWRYRCIVTDQNLDSVSSDEALLTVKKEVPKTGDDIDQALMAFLLGIILLAGLFGIRPQRKEQKNR